MAEQRKTTRQTKTDSSGEKTETIIEEFVTPDGVKTVKKTIIRRTTQGGGGGGAGGVAKSADLTSKFKTMSLKSKKEVNIKEWEQKVLKEHNDYRAKHGCAPLELSREVGGVNLFCGNFRY